MVEGEYLYHPRVIASEFATPWGSRHIHCTPTLPLARNEGDEGAGVWNEFRIKATVTCKIDFPDTNLLAGARSTIGKQIVDQRQILETPDANITRCSGFGVRGSWE